MQWVVGFVQCFYCCHWSLEYMAKYSGNEVLDKVIYKAKHLILYQTCLPVWLLPPPLSALWLLHPRLQSLWLEQLFHLCAGTGLLIFEEGSECLQSNKKKKKESGAPYQPLCTAQINAFLFSLALCLQGFSLGRLLWPVASALVKNKCYVVICVSLKSQGKSPSIDLLSLHLALVLSYFIRLFA